MPKLSDFARSFRNFLVGLFFKKGPTKEQQPPAQPVKPSRFPKPEYLSELDAKLKERQAKRLAVLAKPKEKKEAIGKIKEEKELPGKIQKDQESSEKIKEDIKTLEEQLKSIKEQIEGPQKIISDDDIKEQQIKVKVAKTIFDGLPNGPEKEKAQKNLEQQITTLEVYKTGGQEVEVLQLKERVKNLETPDNPTALKVKEVMGSKKLKEFQNSAKKDLATAETKLINLIKDRDKINDAIHGKKDLLAETGAKEAAKKSSEAPIKPNIERGKQETTQGQEEEKSSGLGLGAIILMLATLFFK